MDIYEEVFEQGGLVWASREEQGENSYHHKAERPTSDQRKSRVANARLNGFRKVAQPDEEQSKRELLQQWQSTGDFDNSPSLQLGVSKMANAKTSLWRGIRNGKVLAEPLLDEDSEGRRDQTEHE